MQILYTQQMYMEIHIEKTRQYLLCCWFNNQSETDNRTESLHGIEYTGRENTQVIRQTSVQKSHCFDSQHFFSIHFWCCGIRTIDGICNIFSFENFASTEHSVEINKKYILDYSSSQFLRLSQFTFEMFAFLILFSCFRSQRIDTLVFVVYSWVLCKRVNEFWNVFFRYVNIYELIFIIYSDDCSMLNAERTISVLVWNSINRW